ncbi:hypothetical protein KM799_02595 [Clostridium tyrobutyricum]|uniref:hypothetical protein n=1 Tax=Clostridium tyrobutyricum TaxID=1519 RepID=UPI001C388B26|nr:hypothetical protein [Clostridium tyrobutyricum]MBV4445301.1 hypothetical protein [Clostridium tyrobutyricum]MBV4445494.1 hypothetical protein [Clostridium tyrobutyricum]
MVNTTNYNLEKPDKGATGWDVSLNNNFDKIDTEIKNRENEITTNLNKLGDLTNLETTNKDTIVKAINEAFQSGTDVKTNTISAVNEKGGNLSSNASWDDIIQAIKDIQAGGDGNVTGNATTDDILEGKTATVPSGVITGTMPNHTIDQVKNQIVDSSKLSVDSSTIDGTGLGVYLLPPKGYYNGVNASGHWVGIPEPNIISENIKAGKSILGVSGSSTVIDTADGTATTADIARDKTAYVNGQKITGTAETGDTAVGTHILETNITVSTGNKLSGDIIGVPFLPISMYFDTDDFTNAGYMHCNFTGTCAVSKTYHWDFQSWYSYKSSSSNTISGMISPHEHNDIEYPFKATKQSDGTYNVHFDFSDDFTVFTSITTAVQYSFKLIG